MYPPGSRSLERALGSDLRQLQKKVTRGRKNWPEKEPSGAVSKLGRCRVVGEGGEVGGIPQVSLTGRAALVGVARGWRGPPPRPSPSPPLLPPPPPPRQNCRPQSGDEGSSGGPLPPHFPLRAATRRAGPGPGRLRREKRGKRAGGRGRWRSSGTHGCSRWVGQRISSMTPPDLRPPSPVPLLQPPPLVPGWGGGSLSP